MAKNNYETLEEQIGNSGDNESQGLGRLSRPESYGGKSGLDSDEQKSLDKFMSRTRKTETKNEEVRIADGWIPINLDDMGVRSLFYPVNWKFSVRAATVQAVKNWTSIDETRPDQVNNAFNDIIKQCVHIDTNEPVGAGWAQINSWDRFWFICKVRETTFAKGEYNIEFNDLCSECDSEIKYKLTSDALFYEFPDEDIIEKYWDSESGEWHIDPQEYGVDADPIVLYTPKLGKDSAIIDWATARARNGQKIDETFIKFLTWMLNKPSRDMQILSKQIQKCQDEYKSWDVPTFSFVNEVIDNITINQSEKLKAICPVCGEASTASVQFPQGIRALFDNTGTTRKKFGSR